jgi:predicted DNA-binding protein YlxM (UPF0122 family)
MKNTPFEMCLLFDFYGAILTDKQQEVFDLYYNDDLSLSEISEHVGITRQGVRDSIVRAEHTLRNMEEKLGLVARYARLESRMEAFENDLSQIDYLNRTHCHSPELAQVVARMQSTLTAMNG